MADTSLIKNLHPLEVKVLLHYKAGDEISAEGMISDLSFNTGQSNQSLSWLQGKGLVEESRREERRFYEVTDLGRDYADNGTPEQRMIAHVRDEGPTAMPDLARALGLENKDVGSAFGALSKAGVLKMGDGKKVTLADESKAGAVRELADLIAKGAKTGTVEEGHLSQRELELMSGISKKRGAASAPFRLVERETVYFTLTEASSEASKLLRDAGVTGEEVGQLTPELLKTGKWKNASFRPYNVQVPPSRVLPGRRNPYCEYLDLVKDKLVSLGFEEFDGPLVETEFWNSDALFMPQFHSARDIHDVYHVKQPTHAKHIEQPYLDNVAAAHEDGWETGSRGWEYSFDRDFTRRLILRSQGTVMSAKTLHKAKVPGKYFGILRCFRYDQVDATHLSDFYQTEGIVLGEDVNLRTLLGLLEMFAVEVAGATEVKYVPGYFPFTEPSVEVHIKHPQLGWFELGGSGIFRPEVTEPMGIDVPVLAWGLGIDRMALMHLGLSDLRELFSYDLDNIRTRRRT